MKRPEQEIHRAVVSHLNWRAKGNRWLNETVEQRFDRYTIPEPNSGCLLWLGTVDKNGYGQLRVSKRAKFASHIALEIAGRPVPEGKCALHRCDNPACVNADHLFIGTQLVNIADMYSKKRGNLSGLAFGRAPRLPASVSAEARRLYQAGESGRSIGRKVGISRTLACQWIKKWKAENAAA